MYVHEEEHLNKLDPRAWKGKLVGYAKHCSTYHIWNPATNKLRVSRNVVFDEKMNETQKSKSKDPLNKAITIMTVEEPQQEDEPDHQVNETPISDQPLAATLPPRLQSELEDNFNGASYWELQPVIQSTTGRPTRKFKSTFRNKHDIIASAAETETINEPKTHREATQ